MAIEETQRYLRRDNLCGAQVKFEGLPISIRRKIAKILDEMKN